LLHVLLCYKDRFLYHAGVKVDPFNVVVLALMLPLAAWLAFPTRKRIVRAGQRWAAEWRAYVPPEVVPAFDRRTKANMRLGGLGIALIAVAAASPLGDQRTAGPLLASVMGFLMPVLVWRAARGMPSLRAEDAVRVARSRATTFTDYLSGWSFAIVGFCALAPAVYFLVNDDADWGRGAFLVAVGFQTLSGLLSMLLLIRIARTSLPAADRVQLYLQDADRASSMCWAVSVPAWSAFFLLQQLSFRGALSRTDWYMTALLIAGAPVVALSVLVWDARRRFRRRLWPEVGEKGGAQSLGQHAPSGERG
jgi:hypothetical protein